jgi:hypothetical protein
LSLIATLDVVDAAAAGAATLKAATPTVQSAVSLTAADLIAGGKTALASCPRQVRFTVAGGTAADAPATATVKGWTLKGYVEETVTLPQTATTVDTTNFFARIDEITYPAADGTGATVAIGFTSALGLPAKAVGRGASSAVFAFLQELQNGAAPASAGSLTSPATHLPFGSYTPHSTLLPNAALDYLVRFECEANVRW